MVLPQPHASLGELLDALLLELVETLGWSTARSPPKLILAAVSLPLGHWEQSERSIAFGGRENRDRVLGVLRNASDTLDAVEILDTVEALDEVHNLDIAETLIVVDTLNDVGIQTKSVDFPNIVDADHQTALGVILDQTLGLMASWLSDLLPLRQQIHQPLRARLLYPVYCRSRTTFYQGGRLPLNLAEVMLDPMLGLIAFRRPFL